MINFAVHQSCKHVGSLALIISPSGYKGVFMHEVRAGVNATPENVVKAYKEVILGKMKK